MRSRTSSLLVAVSTILLIGAPAASADLDEIVYLHQDSSERYRPAVDNGAGPTVVADVDSISPPAISPDGTEIAFSGAVGDESLGIYAIFIADRDGSSVSQLTSGNVGEFDPAWSPDGETIVASQNTGGSLDPASCCRLVRIDVSSGQQTALTTENGARRPSFAPNGSFVVYDTPQGVYRVPSGGGPATFLAPAGLDAAVSPKGGRVAYLFPVGSGFQVRTVPAAGGPAAILYSTGSQIEDPVWDGDRLYFLEFDGLGYDGRKSPRIKSMTASGGDRTTERTFNFNVVGVTPTDNDEIFFYRDDGTFRYYDITAAAVLGGPTASGPGYTANWSSISNVDLDGDGSDEMLFYRAADGNYKYYDVKPNGELGAFIRGGLGYSKGWSSISAIDLDGDGRDEMFFYREDGTFRYYDINPNATLGAPLASGSGFSPNWDSISAFDLDGDGFDEQLFYHTSDGSYKYYETKPGGGLGSLIRAASDYPPGWSMITAIDLDGDARDEVLFYRVNGNFGYFDIRANGSLGSSIESGSGYSSGWDSITAVQLDR